MSSVRPVLLDHAAASQRLHCLCSRAWHGPDTRAFVAALPFDDWPLLQMRTATSKGCTMLRYQSESRGCVQALLHASSRSSRWTAAPLYLVRTQGTSLSRAACAAVSEKNPEPRAQCSLPHRRRRSNRCSHLLAPWRCGKGGRSSVSDVILGSTVHVAFVYMRVCLPKQVVRKKNLSLL